MDLHTNDKPYPQLNMSQVDILEVFAAAFLLAAPTRKGIDSKVSSVSCAPVENVLYSGVTKYEWIQNTMWSVSFLVVLEAETVSFPSGLALDTVVPQ